MNIKRAKQEIKDSIQAYLSKDAYGAYEIPVIHQRPILLIGPPGIGKTQIMQQISQECKIGLVAYTITHHTRQSAIGLPYIVEKEYGGRRQAATEYTMSEIVASIYEEMEKTGLREGILFIDEINCVSETLAPAMLQFLQCKTFGSHVIPQGWIIVAAGNPPEYNKSVREFDLVTLDRVKKIDVTADFSAWKEYAAQAGIHPAVISYLNIRKAYFSVMETTVDGKRFATPRGWEDLSRFLTVYEKLGKPMDREVVLQYIQHPRVASDFANYLELYQKYQTDYQVDAVLEGKIDPILGKKAAHASFDERLSVIGLFLSHLFQDFREYGQMQEVCGQVFAILREYRDAGQNLEDFRRLLRRTDQELADKKRAKLLSRQEERQAIQVCQILERCLTAMCQADDGSGGTFFEAAKSVFQLGKNRLEDLYHTAVRHLEHVMDFMEAFFGSGQELVIFITELNGNVDSVRFLSQYHCERYYLWNSQLLLEEKRQELLRRMEEWNL